MNNFPQSSSFRLWIGVSSIASIAALIAACAGGGGGGNGGGPTPPPPTPTPASVATPLVGCPGGPPAAVARRPMSLAMSFAHRFPQSTQHEPYLRGKILVRFSSEAEAEQSLVRVSATRLTTANSDGYSAVGIPQSADPAAFAESLRGQAGIADAQPIQARYLQSETIPNDTDFGINSQICTGPQLSPIQWDMFVTWMPEAWFTQMGPGVKIAIIDTGVDLTNADVAPNVITADNAVFDKTTGVQDGVNVQDGDGHGTNTSGIAASVTNNITRFAGTSWNSSLIEVRVFPTPTAIDPTPGASNLDIAAGINWAVSKGANVISLSLGGTGSCDLAESTAISNAVAAGIVVVAASGNEGSSTSIDVPANCTGAIAVGASALDDTTNPAQPKEKIASYSNSLGNNTWGVVAPGGDPSAAQLSCTFGVNCDLLQWIINAYSTTAFMGPGTGVLIAGTSQATPHVAGIIALMRAKDASLTPAQATSIIENNTDSIVNAGTRQGFGRVNAIKALNATP